MKHLKYLFTGFCLVILPLIIVIALVEYMPWLLFVIAILLITYGVGVSFHDGK